MSDLSATAFIRTGTVYHPFDWVGTSGRVVGIEFDGLTIQVGGGWDGGRDATIVAATGALIDQLDKLRTAAAERIALDGIDELVANLSDGVVFVGTVGEFLDGITDQAPGELMEAFGK
jgi:hypothetical protein